MKKAKHTEIYEILFIFQLNNGVFKHNTVFTTVVCIITRQYNHTSILSIFVAKKTRPNLMRKITKY